MYTNAKYYTNLNGDNIGIQVEINGSLCFVPIDESNIDYVNIMKLVETENFTIEPAD